MARRREPSGRPDDPNTPFDESMVDVEEKPLPTISVEDQAIIDEAAAKVADTAAMLAEAQRDLDTAKAEHEAAVAAAEPKPVFGEHILVDLHRSGSYAIHKAPPNWEAEKPRRLTVDGLNVELVGVTGEGVWQYRAM